MNRLLQTEPSPPSSERMWPLDVGLGALGTLAAYLIGSHLRFDDPRPLHNAWTYIAVIVAGIIGLSLVSRYIASRFFEQSAQLGFLASILIHLGMLLMAVNVVVFGRYLPESLSGPRRERVVDRKTVPDYLFTQPSPRASRPDWTQPVPSEDAAAAPETLERPLIPPQDQPGPQLEFPANAEPPPPESQPELLDRAVAGFAMPMPADAPGELSRNVGKARPERSPVADAAPIDVPASPAANSAALEAEARPLDAVAARSRPAAAAATIANLELPDNTIPNVSTLRNDPSLPSLRSAQQDEFPQIGQFADTPSRPALSPARLLDPAGSTPSNIPVTIPNPQPLADRTLSPSDTPLTRDSRPVGPELRLELSDRAPDRPDPRPVPVASSGRSVPANRDLELPRISAGSAESIGPLAFRESRSRDTTRPLIQPIPDSSGSVADTDLAAAAALATRFMTGDPASPIGDPTDRLDQAATPSRSASRPGVSTAITLSSEMNLDLKPTLPIGPGGMGQTPADRVGLAPPAQQSPEIGDISPRPNPRRGLVAGSPMKAAGDQLAAPEIFRRRVMRTSGGGLPNRSTVVGPETEEAIERGLKFLASRQTAAGHWSLQGHGEQVSLRSDTAATGLCLLAFQGAGYTHQQHRYASVVSRGLQALLAMQRPDGNLYRQQDPISDQSVSLYSHGIATLALCEAYGMTRDESLRGPAQNAIDYIVQSQHRERGGWRYEPQISSDTSVSGWMMMALKSGELAGLKVPISTYEGIDRWLDAARMSRSRNDLYRYNPYAPNTPAQSHGREVTPSMTAVAILMRMYSGWRREDPDMRSAADYLAKFPPAIGDASSPQRDTYYWYYATQVMFHMGGQWWQDWNQRLKPILIDGQIQAGPQAGSWDPLRPVPDRWSLQAGRLYLTTLNLLSLEVHYRHLPIYETVAR